jgi:hypothetical protein
MLVDRPGFAPGPPPCEGGVFLLDYQPRDQAYGVQVARALLFELSPQVMGRGPGLEPGTISFMRADALSMYARAVRARHNPEWSLLPDLPRPSPGTNGVCCWQHLTGIW